MKESSEKSTLQMQKLTIGLCALMTLYPAFKTAVAIYQKDKQTAKKAAVGTFFCGIGLGTSITGYLINPRRKKDHD